MYYGVYMDPSGFWARDDDLQQVHVSYAKFWLMQQRGSVLWRIIIRWNAATEILTLTS